MSQKLRVGIVGATGMVGQRFILLLDKHPTFTVTCLAASARSSGKSYAQAVEGRWAMKQPIPEYAQAMQVVDASDIPAVSAQVDFIFCAVDMPKNEVLALEEAYARAETPVVSNNSAARMVADVPMLIPEINASHTQIIPKQRLRLGTKRGFIAVKPNCSIQSYVPALEPLRSFGLKEVFVSTYQAISGAGKTFETWPEMLDNVIPLIKGEEEKSEKEPLKVWGSLQESAIVPSSTPKISAQCLRVPVSDGHMASVSVSFDTKPSREEILAAWASYQGPELARNLPHSPEHFLHYFEEENRPQTRLDRDLEGGMGISIGRLREDPILDWKFVALSHNTLRGAAGGAVLMAEYLHAEGWF